MKKFVYTFILAIGFQFAQAQKIDTIFLVQSSKSGILFQDMKDFNLKDYPIPGQNYNFILSVRFTNNAGRTLYVNDSINEEDGEIASPADSIRVEIRMNNTARYPLVPGSSPPTFDPDQGYISPASQDLKVRNDSLLLDTIYSDRNIAAGESGFLGLKEIEGKFYAFIQFEYSKGAIRTGKDDPNTICVKLTHRKSGDNTAIPLSEELCINVYLIKDTVPKPPEDNIVENTLNTVKIHPNPTRDRIKIENLNETTDISIYSIAGQLLTNISSAVGDIEIDVSKLANGVYFIKMQNRQNTRTAKVRIVK